MEEKEATIWTGKRLEGSECMDGDIQPCGSSNIGKGDQYCVHGFWSSTCKERKICPAGHEIRKANHYPFSQDNPNASLSSRKEEKASNPCACSTHCSMRFPISRNHLDSTSNENGNEIAFALAKTLVCAVSNEKECFIDKNEDLPIGWRACTAQDSYGCFPCLPGTYKSEEGTQSCNQCETNTGKIFIGSGGKSEICQYTCDYGFYSENNTCVLCPPGWFKDWQGTDLCIPCTDEPKSKKVNLSSVASPFLSRSYPLTDEAYEQCKSFWVQQKLAEDDYKSSRLLTTYVSLKD